MEIHHGDQYHHQHPIPGAPLSVESESWEDYLHYGVYVSGNIHHASGKGHRRLIKAAKRVQRANKKLIDFERGFISKDGISGREWYKHLGVAPGKWLGYGATTLPALTEAITLEGNATLAELEAGRLIDLISGLTSELRG